MKSFTELLSEIAMNDGSGDDNDGSGDDIDTFIHNTIMSHPNASMLSSDQIEKLKSEGKLFNGLGHNRNVIEQTLHRRIEEQFK